MDAAAVQAQTLRGKIHSDECFQRQWRCRLGLISSVDGADVKGFPPARWPRRGFDQSSLGIATLLGAEPSMLRRSAFEMLNEEAGGTLLADDSKPAPKPRGSPRLKSLLEAFDAAPWKQAAPTPSRGTRRSRPVRPPTMRQDSPGLVQRAQPSLNVLGRPSTAVPPSHKPRHSGTKTLARPFSAPAPGNSGSLHILSLLASCEAEINSLLKDHSPPQQFQHLCCAMLLVVSTAQDVSISWREFQDWAQRFNGAAGFLQSLKTFDAEAVDVAVAERAVQYMVKHKIFPELFHLGSVYYTKRCIPKFAPPFCRWIWNVCRKALGAFGTSCRPNTLATPMKSLVPTPHCRDQ